MKINILLIFFLGMTLSGCPRQSVVYFVNNAASLIEIQGKAESALIDPKGVIKIESDSNLITVVKEGQFSYPYLKIKKDNKLYSYKCNFKSPSDWKQEGGSDEISIFLEDDFTLRIHNGSSAENTLSKSFITIEPKSINEVQ